MRLLVYLPPCLRVYLIQLRMQQLCQRFQPVDETRPRAADKVIVEGEDLFAGDGFQLFPAGPLADRFNTSRPTSNRPG